MNHRPHRVLLMILSAFAVAFLFSAGLAQEVVEEEGVPPEEAAVAADEEAGSVEATEEIVPKVVHMLAENWKWTPKEILVRKGTHVVLEIQSYGAPHSFLLKAYRLKVPLPEKKTTRIEFVADKVGKFTWRCGRPCGDGCAKMRGKLIVTE